PWSPGFVTNAPISDVIRFNPAIFCTAASLGCGSGAITVFKPSKGLVQGTTAEVYVDVRLHAGCLAEVEKLICAEVIGLGSAPMKIWLRLTLCVGTDGVFPVINVGKTSTGPAHNGWSQLFYCVNRVHSQADRVAFR